MHVFRRPHHPKHLGSGGLVPLVLILLCALLIGGVLGAPDFLGPQRARRSAGPCGGRRWTTRRRNARAGPGRARRQRGFVCFVVRGLLSRAGGGAAQAACTAAHSLARSRDWSPSRVLISIGETRVCCATGR